MIKEFITVSVLTIIIFCLLVYIFQRYLIYYPDKSKPSLQNFQTIAMQELVLSTSDGLSLIAWYKPAVNNQATIVYFHGNAGNISYRMPFAKYFIAKGFGVLLLEYRGYGGNKGSPSEQGLYADARAAMAFLQQKGIKPEQTIIFGESLGTSVATKMAEEHPSCALILQSPFTALVDVAQYHYPWMFIGPWDKFNSLGRITKIKTPLLIIHGSKDQIVPFHLGQKLFETANQPKEMLVIKHKKHNDLWNLEFFTNVLRFMEEHCTLDKDH